MKKVYDLIIKSAGHVHASIGAFERSHRFVFGDKPFPHEDYKTFELPLSICRVRKSDLDGGWREKKIMNYISRARKHQEMEKGE